jgi:hypothetical protein
LPHPFALAVCDEGIDNDLSSIKEITKLSFPDDKVIWIID